MLIGILSDTHNNTDNLNKALNVFRDRGVETLFQLGDMTMPICLPARTLSRNLRLRQ
jgi:predicted phosphodiesterase